MVDRTTLGAATTLARAPASPVRRRVSGDESGDRRHVDDPQRQSDRQGHDEGVGLAQRGERHQAGRGQRPATDGEAQRGGGAGETTLDVGTDVDRQAGVDVPGLERARFERPEHPLDHGGRQEPGRAVRRDQEGNGDDVERRRHQQHRPAPERIGETTGGQLEHHHDDALRRRHHADLCERQAP
jgi:hypothetical protein